MVAPTRRAAIALLVLLALVPFLPMLVRGEVPTFRDHADYFIPLRYHTAERLAQGDLPLWNPYSGSGERWLANPQTAVFYPPAWLFLALPFSAAYALFLAVHLALLGAGSWLLFRRWSGEGALAGAVVVMLGGPTLSLLDVSNNLATLAWIPLVVHLALGRAGIGWRAIAIAMMFLGGEPLLAAIGAALHAAAFLATRRFRSGYGELSAVAVLAAALAAAQLVPFLDLLRGSDRSGGFAASDSLRNSIAPLDWLFLVLSPSNAFPPLPASQHFIPALYVGVPALVLALAGIWAGVTSGDARRRAVIVATSACAVVALVTAAGSIGVAGEIWMRLALNISRYPARFAPFASIAIGLLVAIGFDAVARLTRSERATILLLGAVVLGSALHRLRPLSLDAQRGRVAIAVAAFAAMLAALIFGARLFERRAFALAFAAVVAADLCAAAAPLLRSAPFTTSIAPYDRLLSRDEKLLRLPRRSDGDSHPYARKRRAWLSGYLNLFGPRFDASTPAPVVSRDYLAIHDAALTVPRFDLVDLLSVGALLTDREIRQPGFRRETIVNGVSLYRNLRAFPPVTIWRRSTATATTRAALARTLDRANDARATLFITGATSAARAEPAVLRARASWRIEGDAATIDVDVGEAAIVVMNQLAAPGWRVSIDGREAAPLVANGAFRAVAVPAGAHRIEWSYRPRFLAIGIAISAIAIVAAAVLLRKRSEKNSRPD